MKQKHTSETLLDICVLLIRVLVTGLQTDVWSTSALLWPHPKCPNSSAERWIKIISFNIQLILNAVNLHSLL